MTRVVSMVCLSIAPPRRAARRPRRSRPAKVSRIGYLCTLPLWGTPHEPQSCVESCQRAADCMDRIREARARPTCARGSNATRHAPVVSLLAANDLGRAIPAGGARAGGRGHPVRWTGEPSWLAPSGLSRRAARRRGTAERAAYIVSASSGRADGPGWQAFRDGLQSLGYVEGKTIVVDWRWAGSDASRMTDLAADLVRSQVELIVTGSDPAPTAARNATRTLPIVMVGAGDPVASGLVASLARPGGNVTGLTWDVSPDVAGKQLELLKDTKPGLSSVAVLWNRDAGTWVSPYLSVLRSTATTLGLALHPIEVRRPEEIAPAFAELTRRSVQAVYVMWDQVTFTHRTRVGEPGSRPQAPDDLRRTAIRGGRRPHVLLAEHRRPVPARGHLRRQDPQGRQARPTCPSSSPPSSSWSSTSRPPRPSASRSRRRCSRGRMRSSIHENGRWSQAAFG